jgi:deoxyadenosine/deoxycytidine kinase
MYLAIEGVIGVGKTTLARLLAPAFDAAVLLEAFEENPFLSDFYGDRARYGFQTQIFFLLSRYRHQEDVRAALARGNLIADYTFAKDRLFARVILAGDELALYERLHDALAERVIRPDLVVYLRADTDTLMRRIAFRDRPYERGMDRTYIEHLRLAYERFFAEYQAGPVLAVDTDRLDFVQDPAQLAVIFERVKSALGIGTYQPALPLADGGR